MELEVENLKIKVIKRKCSKNIVLRVNSYGQVKVTAPKRVLKREIETLVFQKLEKIQESIEKVKANSNYIERKFVTGEEHYFLGNKYKLVVNITNKSSVKIENNNLLLNINKKLENTRENKEKILNKFYKEQLLLILNELIPKAEQKMQVSAREYKIKNMKTKWGTCNITQKRIWLNLQLAKKPIECLESVLYHELTHLYEKNHTKRFYNLLDYYYPKWREIEEELQRKVY
ncbi:M48 family metallopeptidase [Gemelliphila palaticanis]|uniref:M48 family metallopeptidase n=1 Tax=Gemelliphila palaticanis TaxID=81950 RepID=A0ABX2T076_9BACL|nr:SprT family zinc-dependent metalloprotease [Gemella palaticanis]MBF0716105.1 M48 family metallopeptidase [Gemella palaticanis]NYS48035.1 M48 family metallopeptidase [Gemella palaticanis]